MSSFTKQIEEFKVRLQRDDGESLLPAIRQWIQEMPKQTMRDNAAVYLFKELLEEYAKHRDSSCQQGPLRLHAELCYLVDIGKQSPEMMHTHYILRLYNTIVRFVSNQNCNAVILHSGRLLTPFQVTGEFGELFERLEKVMLRVVCDQQTRQTVDKELLQTGIDFVVETHLKLMRYWASVGTKAGRTKVITLFRNVFDNVNALLYRIFCLNKDKAQQLHTEVIKVMHHEVQLEEQELIDLQSDIAIPFIETILSIGDNNNDWRSNTFTDFMVIFDGITHQPEATCIAAVKLFLEILQQETPNEPKIRNLTQQLKQLSGQFLSHPQAGNVAVFIATYLSIYVARLKKDTLPLALPLIELTKYLMKFVKHCPRGLQSLCSKCNSSGRHMADYLCAIIMQMGLLMVKSGTDTPAETVILVSDVIIYRFKTLDDLECEKQDQLLNCALRAASNWIKYCLDIKSVSYSEQLLAIVRMIVPLKYKYGFQFISNMFLVRLWENCYTDNDCWTNLSIRLVKLLLTLRDKSINDWENALRTAIRAIMAHQINQPEEGLLSLNVVQLLEHARFDRLDFRIDTTLTDAEKFTLLECEMQLARKYKTCNQYAYFEQLWQLRQTDYYSLGMCLYFFGDSNFNLIPLNIVEELHSALLKCQPRTAEEKIKRFASLGIINYYRYGITHKEIMSRITDLNLTADSVRNNKIDEALVENQMDQEIRLLRQMDATFMNFAEMIFTLAGDNFELYHLIPSVTQISTMLDNTARLFQMNFLPKRAVEMQLVNYLFVQVKDDRLPDHCGSLGFLLEYHALYEQLLLEERYRKPYIWSLPDLSAKADELLQTLQSQYDEIASNRKFYLLNLFISQALYKASLGSLEDAVQLIQMALELSDRPSSTQSIALLTQARISQAIFRLVTDYDLPPPAGSSPGTYIRLMMSQFNELQKPLSEYPFFPSTMTIEVVVAVLQYSIIRHNTDFLEAQVEQVLRFALRRGSGLRAMQLLLLYATTKVDGEKLNKCEVLLSYVDRLLMLRPIVTRDKRKSSENSQEFIKLNQIMVEDGGLDATRKAVKYVKSPSRSISPMVPIESEVTVDQYLFRHNDGCSCHYCQYPQYQCVAFLSAALSARMRFLNRSHGLAKEFYHALWEHWTTRFEGLVREDPSLVGYRDEVRTSVVRMFMQMGQFLTKQSKYESATLVFDVAVKLATTVSTIDAALLEEITFSTHNCVLLQQQQTKVKPAKRQHKSFQVFLNDQLPIIEMTKLVLKTPSASVKLLLPKTADRATDLTKQAARRRMLTTQTKSSSGDALHYLKSGGIINSKSQMTGSERKPQKVNVFIDSPESESKSGKGVAFTPNAAAALQRPLATPATEMKSVRKKQLPRCPQTVASTFGKSTDKPSLDGDTPQIKNGRDLSKRSRLKVAFPRLSDEAAETTDGQPTPQTSRNEPFRNKLLKTMHASTSATVTKVHEAAVIELLDDSDEEVINASVSECQSPFDNTGGSASLKTYSERKRILAATSSAKKNMAKIKLRFNDDSIIDITSPSTSPATLSRELNSIEQKDTKESRRQHSKTPSKRGRTKKRPSVEDGAIPLVETPLTTRSGRRLRK